MLVFRLFRVGKINQPSFKIVVTDKRNSSKGGRFVEQVGSYSPITKEKILNKERAQYWLSQGVQPSDTIYNLFMKEGILEGKKIPVHKKSKKAPAPVPTATVVGSAVAEAPKAAEAPKPADKPVEKPADKMLEAKPPTSEALGRSPATGEAPKTE
ncbi:MAG: 30S ribosomal protein S16 [Candidatus Nealsonbacteria bacterium]